MTLSPLARDLKRKSERALASARELRDRDPDGSVNRSYYAMFDLARAALLSSGVPEHELPRTHNGVIAAFSQHAVQSGRVDQKVAAALGRAESLRLLADYTGTALDPKTAADTVARAEAFVGTVARVFALDEPSVEAKIEGDGPGHEGKVSEPAAAERGATDYSHLQPFSLEEARRQARENWLRLKEQTIKGQRDSSQERNSDRSAKEEYGHAPDPDLDD